MEQLTLFLRTVVNCTFPAALLFVMADFRCKRRTAWWVYCGILLVSMTGSILLLRLFGEMALRRYFFLTFLLPLIAAMLLLTTDRPSFILFNCFTAINLLYFITIVGGILTGQNDRLFLADLAIRTLLYGLVLFVFRQFLCEPYHFLARNMRREWRVIAVIPFLFFALVMFMGLYPTVRTDNFYSVFFLYIILGFVYYIIYRIFRSTYDLLLHKQDHQLLEAQVSALRLQTEAVQRSELETRILRHDMRHVLKNIAAQLAAGDLPGAQHCLCLADEHIAHVQTATGYCENPVVNATLAYYLSYAAHEGIEVSTHLSVPNELPVDALELATVFANALENAIHACQKLPPEQRRIDCRCRWSPHFLLEITNTYNGELQRDRDALPVNKQQNHGIGTRSIMAFVEKYGSIIDYYSDEELFGLRIAQVITTAQR